MAMTYEDYTAQQKGAGLHYFTDPKTGAEMAYDQASNTSWPLSAPTDKKTGGPPNTIVTVPGTGKTIGMFDATGAYRDVPATTSAASPAPQGGGENDPTIRTYDPATNTWVTTPNPAYVAPRDPVADAINARAPVTTPEQAGATAGAIATAQANVAYATYQQDVASGKVLPAAAAAKLEADLAEIKAQHDDVRARQLAQEARTGTSEAATILWDRQAQGRADATALAQAGEARAMAGETRAQGADARAAQQAHFTQTQAQAGVYTAQAEQGQGIVDQATKLGVRISGDEYKALYFDPHARALALLGQAMQGTDFDPHARAIGLIGQQMQPAQAIPAAPSAAPPAQVPPPAPQIYDSSPSGSSIGGQAPNVPTPLWQQGPAATGMANDQTSLWGQDKPTQSLFLSTYNNDPILASQMWAKQHNAPPQAPTVGPPRAPTLN